MDPTPVQTTQSALPQPVHPPFHFNFRSPIAIGICIAMGIGVGIFLGVTSPRQKTNQPIPAQTLSPGISPTLTEIPFDEWSSITTDSAYQSLEQSIATMSSELFAYQPADTSLLPPAIDLPLGLE